jgi:hypothetical protein
MMSGRAALNAMPIILLRLIYRVKEKASYLSQIAANARRDCVRTPRRSTLASSR